MKAKALYQEGKLNEAIQSLSAELRDNPTDAKRRTFLFELLCFAGEYDRADKHVNLLADTSGEAKMGAVLYLSAIHGEKVRHKTFTDGDFPTSPVDPSKLPSGVMTLTNGEEIKFESIEDSDPRIGPRLEVFAAGAYLWIGFEHIESIEFDKITKLRDLLWRPAIVRTGPSFKETELGQVLAPGLFAFSHKHSDDQVRLGRATVWDTSGEDPVPYGQKTFLVDGQDYSIMEIHSIEFDTVAETGDSAE